MRVEDVRAWLCEQLDVAPESMVSVNDLWMNYLDPFDGNLKDRQMAYWKSLGCPYDHYNHMEEWWGGYMNAWPRIAELQTELASYMESDANLRKRVEELEALVANLSESLTGCNENNRKFAKEFRKHIALEDGLRELAEQHHGAICSSWSEWDQGRQDGRNAVVTDIEALLGKGSEDG